MAEPSLQVINQPTRIAKESGAMSEDENNVIQLSKHKKEKQEQMRREYERYVFESFIGCFIIEDNKEIMIYSEDISKSGLKFRWDSKNELKSGDVVTLRMYFTNSLFIDNKVEIVRAIADISQGVKRTSYACKFDTFSKSYETIQKLVNLIESFTDNARAVKQG